MSPAEEADALEAIMRLVADNPEEAARRFCAIPVIETYQALAIACHMIISNALDGAISFTATIPGEEPVDQPPAN